MVIDMKRIAKRIRRKETSAREIGGAKGLTFEKTINNRIIATSQEGQCIVFGWGMALDLARQFGQ